MRDARKAFDLVATLLDILLRAGWILDKDKSHFFSPTGSPGIYHSLTCSISSLVNLLKSNSSPLIVLHFQSWKSSTNLLTLCTSNPELWEVLRARTVAFQTLILTSEARISFPPKGGLGSKSFPNEIALLACRNVEHDSFLQKCFQQPFECVFKTL